CAASADRLRFFLGAGRSSGSSRDSIVIRTGGSSDVLLPDTSLDWQQWHDQVQGHILEKQGSLETLRQTNFAANKILCSPYHCPGHSPLQLAHLLTHPMPFLVLGPTYWTCVVASLPSNAKTYDISDITLHRYSIYTILNCATGRMDII
ncbi:hypothetical protein MAR_008837, partial [Mya arenaria]